MPLDAYAQWAVRVNRAANKPFAPQPSLLPCSNNPDKVWVKLPGGYVLQDATEVQRARLAELYPEMPKP